jgi:hypothetical protein
MSIPVLCPSGNVCPNEEMSSYIPCPTGSTCLVGSMRLQIDNGEDSSDIVLEKIGELLAVLMAVVTAVAQARQCCAR